MTNEHEIELQNILNYYTSRFRDMGREDMIQERLYNLIGKIENAARNESKVRSPFLWKSPSPESGIKMYEGDV